jgi:hypothetical protein
VKEATVQVLHGAAHPFLAATGAAAAGPLSASFWLASLGAVGVFVVVFAETGLLAGFFPPGDRKPHRGRVAPPRSCGGQAGARVR